MTTIDQPLAGMGGGFGILDRERIIATAGFNRWLVPPAARCIHLCIGMAYGFSVFWLPLSRALGITASKSCPDMSLVQELFTTTDVHAHFRSARRLGGDLGRLARACRTA